MLHSAKILNSAPRFEDWKFRLWKTGAEELLDVGLGDAPGACSEF